MTRTRIFVIVIILLVLLYAGIFFYRQQQLYKKSCFKPSGFKINKLQLFDVDIDLNVEFKNKTDLDFNIISSEFDVYVNDYVVSHIEGTEEAIARAGMPAIIPLKITFNPVEVLQISLNNIASLFQAKDKIRIRIKGKLNLSSGFIFVNSLPVDFSYTIGELLTQPKTPC